MEPTEWVDRSDLLIPENRAYVYLFSDRRLRTLYVGQTITDPVSRFYQHRSASKPWFAHAAHYRYREVTRDTVMAVEASLIHQLHPIGNGHCPKCDHWPTGAAKGGYGATLAAIERRSKKI